MKKLLVLFFPVFLIVGMGLPGCKNVFGEQAIFTTTTFKSTDGLEITGDIYATNNPDAPWILLFHQAGYSRGEYREIAPKLNEMGFNCLAIDQRSGNEVNGVVNMTHKAAEKDHLATEYPDAFPDLEAALLHVKNRFHTRKMIIWGSSYSASLVFILASKHQSDVTAVVAFSPGEYFTSEGKKVADFAKDVDCPVFITSASSEHDDWKNIYESLGSKANVGFLPAEEGNHGPKALWESKEGNEEYWKAITMFLKNLL